MIQTTQQLSTTISVDEKVLEVFANMPDALKIEVLHYAEYLLNKEIDKPSSSNVVTNNDLPRQKYRKAGTMRGMIIMADDFDEPLAELQEYMD
jgi:hypothetical protein